MICTVQIYFGAIEGQGINKVMIIGVYYLDSQVFIKERRGGLKLLNRHSMVLSTIL